MDMLKKLQNKGVQVITVEMTDEALINRNAALFKKPMFWNFGRKAMGAPSHLPEGRTLTA